MGHTAKRIFAYVAKPDMLMAIDSRTKGHFRVIAMNHFDSIKSKRAIDCSNRRF